MNALVVAGRELRARLRDRTALLLALVVPFVLATVVSVALGGVGRGGGFRLGVADLDGGPVAGQIRAGLADPSLRGVLRSRSEPSEAAARRDLAAGRVRAVLVLRPGLSAAVAGGRPVPLDVLTARGRFTEGAVAQAVAQEIVARLDASRVAAATAADLGTRPAAAPLTISLADVSVGSRAAGPASYYGPAMALLAVHLTVAFAGRGLWAERRLGTLRRLGSIPVTLPTLLVGKAAAALLLGTAGTVVLWLAISLVFGVTWGPAGAVLALVVAAVLASVGIAGLVAGLVRNEDQVVGATTAVTFVLSIAGGTVVPVYQLHGPLRAVAALSPNGWALRGFSALAIDGRSAGAAVVPVLALLAFALVTGTVGVLRLRRLVPG